MFSEEINQKIAAWEKELQSETGRPNLKLIATLAPQEERSWISLECLTEIAALVTGHSVKEIRGKCRKRTITLGRQLVYYFASENRYYLTDIGRFLGGRDHTTVLHGKSALEDLLFTKHPAAVNAFEQTKVYLDQLRNTINHADR